MAARNKPNELYITRVYDAPVKLVWEAWTDPKKVAKWWGPRGFTLTSKEKNVRPGGSWTYTMHGPDGVDYPNHTVFHEVEPYSRLVYDHGANDKQAAMFRVTVVFTEIHGKTKMDMTMTLASAEAAAEIKRFIKSASGDSTWDRLAEFLSATDKFVINRSFEAPIDVMYEMWTNPKHLGQWMPPKGFTTEYYRAEIKPGGSSFSCMTGPGGIKMYGKLTYLELKKPHLVKYTQVFCDEHENITRHPMSPTWPETLLATVQLAEEGPHQTRVTLTWEIYGEATAAERETFAQAKLGMNQGFTGSFDKLEEYLRKIT